MLELLEYIVKRIVSNKEPHKIWGIKKNRDGMEDVSV